MGALGVAPEHVIEEFIVALGEVVIEEQVFVVVQEFLLDGAVEAFGMGIHLGGLRVGVPVDQGLLGHGGGEVFHEFTAVVGEHGLDPVGEHGGGEVQKALSGGAGVAGGRHGDTDAAIQVDGGEHVAAHPVADALHGIEGPAVAGVPRPKALGLAGLGGGPALRATLDRGVAHLIRGVLNQTPDRALAGARQAVAQTEGFEQQRELGLAQSGPERA